MDDIFNAGAWLTKRVEHLRQQITEAEAFLNVLKLQREETRRLCGLMKTLNKQGQHEGLLTKEVESLDEQLQEFDKQEQAKDTFVKENLPLVLALEDVLAKLQA